MFLPGCDAILDSSIWGHARYVYVSNLCLLYRAETKALIGGGVYSYIRVLPDEFLLKSLVITVDFKRNSSGRMQIYEYAPPFPN